MAADKKIKILVLAFVLVVSAPLLFCRLGHYPLWDDEALVALAAKGILETGDTSVYIDHNIVAYRGGILVRDGHDRSTPPLASFIAAAAMAVLGGEAWALRLPFALLGWMTVALLFLWLWREDVPPIVWFMAAVAVLGNVSLFLFFRQCRYYSPVLFFSVASAYLYYAAPRDWGRVVLMSLSLAILFAANYFTCAVVLVCGLVDYLLWGRKTHPFRVPHLVFLVLSLGVVFLAILSVWDPLATGSTAALRENRIVERLILIWLNVRDVNRCEFLPLILLFFLPFVYRSKRELSLLRGAAAFVIFLVVASLLSPQFPVSLKTTADVRYLLPLIPLGIFLTVSILYRLLERKIWLAIIITPLVFWTNLCHEGGMGYAGLRSTLVAYVMELMDPPTDSYTPTIAWVKDNVRPGQSVFVFPNYKTYPLMYHAPHAVYAWQLPRDAPREYDRLPPIHFWGRVAPDFIIVFGPSLKVVQKVREKEGAGDFALVTVLPYYWRDLYRPELFWRTFGSVRYDKNAWEEIYVFRRVK